MPIAERTPYTLDTVDGAARLGSVTTAHGAFETPTFMAVGTHGAVRACLPSEVRECGIDVVLANTYHLACRPGPEQIALFGGLHKMMGWDGPILTDSGGFQALSLSKFAAITDHSITFASPYDGSRMEMTPEDAVQLQEGFGSDIIMCLDHPAAWGASEEEHRVVLERTHAWASRSKEIHDPTHGLLFGIVQGGYTSARRQQSAEYLVTLGMDGYAIGGLSVGEPHELMAELTATVTAALPTDRPRYFMGLGSDPELLELVGCGVDMFDCVLPTRLARHGVALTPMGNLALKHARYRSDLAPLVAGCPCIACIGYSRGVLRHLLNVGDILAHRLLSIHNMTHVADLMRQTRQSIAHGEFASFKAGYLARYDTGLDASRD